MKKLIMVSFVLLLACQLISQTKLDSLKIRLKQVSNREKIEILDQLQEAYWDIYPKASIEYGKKAHKLSRKIKDKQRECIELDNIATGYTLIDNHYKALKNLLLSLELAKKINNDFFISDRLNKISRTYLILKEDIKAFEFSLKALKISNSSKNITGKAVSYFNMGDIYFSLGDIENAISRLELATISFEESGDLLSAGLAQQKIGEILYSQQEYPEAIRFFTDAGNNFLAINDKNKLLGTYNAIGKICQTIEDDAKAYEFFMKYSQLEETLKKEEEESKNLFLYEYYNITGDDEQALKYYKMYSQQLDSLLVKKSKQKIEDIHEKFEIEKQTFKEDKIIDIEKIEKKSDIALKKVKAETIEKEKEIETLKKDKAITELLTQIEKKQKEERIKDLVHEQEISDLKLSKQQRLRNYLIITSFLVSILTILIYSRYRLNKKINIKQQKTNEYILEISQELMEAHKDMEKLARTDPLTKLSNRRDMMEKIEYEKKRFERSGKPFTLVMGDIDNFKSINDKFGHDAGDYVLVLLSEAFLSSIRKQDVCARWGGEEFMLLLPETDIKGGEIISEKIREKISSLSYDYHGTNIHTTITFGVLVYDKPYNLDKFISKADKALYAGKKSGKNKVVCGNMK
ncbi:MAG: GGDEF domain-containing protein [Candidatus Cloacimonetes bacterium]|nr:GGDEF domain-containing protein [Candidatus Cloacimonadota bacterium]